MRKLQFALIALILISCGDGRQSPQGGTITSAQPQTGGGLSGGGTGGAVQFSMLRTCATDDWLIWTGTAWACNAGSPSAPVDFTVGVPDVGCTDYTYMGPNVMVVGDPGVGCGSVTSIDTDSITVGDPLGSYVLIQPTSITVDGVVITPAADITGVTAGVALTGGGTSGALTIDLAFSSDFQNTADTLDLSTTVTAPGTLDTIGNLTENSVRVATLAGAGMTKTGGTFDVACLTGLGCNADSVQIADRDFGDITTTSSGSVWTIDNDVVTYAKMQNVSATSRILGRITAAAGDTEELTGTQATTLLNTFATGATTKGLVPGSNSAGATAYLNGNGGWTVPAGSGVTGTGTANTTTKFTGTSSIGNAWPTDDGATWGVTSKFTITESSGDFRSFGTATVDGTSKFGNNGLDGEGMVYVPGVQGELNFYYGYDGDFTGYINRNGYLGAASRYRNLIVGDGKTASVATFTGSTKTATMHGPFNAIGVSTLTGLVTATAGVTTPANLTTTGTGALVVAGTGTIGSTLDVNASLSKFGFDDGAVYVNEDQLNSGYATNASDYFLLNYNGYLGGATQYRDFKVYDGRNGEIASFTGSTKGVQLAATLGVTGNTTLTGSLAVNGSGTTMAGTLNVTGEVATASNNTLGNSDGDFTNISGRLGFSGTNPTISACGTGWAIAGETQSFQLSPGTGITACVVNLNKTFTAAPYCTFSAANASAANKIASLTGTNGGDEPYITSTTTTMTMNFIVNTEGAPVYNVTCVDRF